MRAAAFFISLFLFLLGGKALDAGAVSPAHHFSSDGSIFLQHAVSSQYAFETGNTANEKNFLFCDDLDDEDERNSLAKKYKDLNKYVIAFSTIQLPHNYYKAPKAVAAQSGACNFPRYILLRTLKI